MIIVPLRRTRVIGRIASFTAKTLFIMRCRTQLDCPTNKPWKVHFFFFLSAQQGHILVHTGQTVTPFIHCVRRWRVPADFGLTRMQVTSVSCLICSVRTVWQDQTQLTYLSSHVLAYSLNGAKILNLLSATLACVLLLWSSLVYRYVWAVHRLAWEDPLNEV